MRLVLIPLIFIALFAVGCASSSTTGGALPGTPAAVPSVASKATQLAGVRVMIIPIVDGGNAEDGMAPGSGAAMTANLRDNLIKRGISPLVIETAALDQAVQQARSMNYEYIIKAGFTDWQDNATEWSSRPDRAAVSAELYDVETVTLLAAITHAEKGSTISMVSQNPGRFYPLISTAVINKFVPVISARESTQEK